MRIPYRQGLISAQPDFLQVSALDSRYVDLAVTPTPTIAAIASGNTDYLIGEHRTVTQAWGPFTGTTTQYLYWEVNQASGIISRGATPLAPITSSTAPATSIGQMWWNSNTNQMSVWDGSRWVPILRVLAGTLMSGAILINEPFISQVGLNTPADAGFIMTDGLGGIFRNPAGQLLTTNTPLLSPGSGSLVKIEGTQIVVQANENIPAFSVVYLANGRAALASSAPGLELSKAPIAMVTIDAYQNDVVELTTQGQTVVNQQWAWPYGVWGQAVYSDATGGLTTSIPLTTKFVRVGTIVGAQQILLTFNWEVDIQYAIGGTVTGIVPSAPITIGGSVNVPVMGITRASTTTDGYMASSDFNRIPAVEAALTTKAPLTHFHVESDISGLTADLASKSPIVHMHSESDVTGLTADLASKAPLVHTQDISTINGLPSQLQTINNTLILKMNTVPGATAGDFAAFDASGNVSDSGFSSSSFALAAHVHAESDITGLIADLAGKSPIVHAHAIADITGLQLALDTINLKATKVVGATSGNLAALTITGDLVDSGTSPSTYSLAVHVHAIADVTGLQGALDNKINIGTMFPISEITGLQTALDSKAAAVHTHVIADVLGLQLALDSKESVIAPGTTAQYWRGDKTWQPFPTVATGDFVLKAGDTMTGNLSIADAIILTTDGALQVSGSYGNPAELLFSGGTGSPMYWGSLGLGDLNHVSLGIPHNGDLLMYVNPTDALGAGSWTNVPAGLVVIQNI
jgi:hypothetical protein